MSNYPPGVTGNEWQITGESPIRDDRPLTSIRVPERVMFYMDSTGWGQGAEKVTDGARRHLLTAKRHKDGTLTIPDPDEELLARLYFEADHLCDSHRFGDHDSDTYADFRAGQKLIAKINAIDPTMDRAPGAGSAVRHSMKTVWQQGVEAGEVSDTRGEVHRIGCQGWRFGEGRLDPALPSTYVDQGTGEFVDNRERQTVNQPMYITDDLAERLFRHTFNQSFEDKWAELMAGARVETFSNVYWVER